VCIRYRISACDGPLPSNDREIFTEPLPGNDREIHIQTHGLMGGYLYHGTWAHKDRFRHSKVNRGGGDTHTERKQRDLIGLHCFFQNKESRLKVTVGLWDHLSGRLYLYPSGQLLKACNNLHEGWCVHHATRGHLNCAIHIPHPLVEPPLKPLKLFGNNLSITRMPESIVIKLCVKIKRCFQQRIVLFYWLHYAHILKRFRLPVVSNTQFVVKDM
jgi:hypothetical protein